MVVEVIETYESRKARFDRDRTNDSIELTFKLAGSESDVEAHAALQQIAPAFYGGLLFQSYELEHLGGGVWEATAEYNLKLDRTPQEQGSQSEPQNNQVSFDTTGGTEHITQAITQLGYASFPALAPDLGNAIGVDGENVNGVDVVTPQLRFQETWSWNNAVIGTNYIKMLRDLTGTTNNRPFRTFDEDEVLFLGATGSKKSILVWEIVYNFAVSKNKAQFFVHDIEVNTKGGWDYLWVRYKDEVQLNNLIKRPSQVYVAQVYEQSDFRRLGIGEK